MGMTGSEGATILIVDDERGPRESLRMILTPAYRVLAARNGCEALEILRTTSVDLVTLDLSMPGLTGDQLMRTIRREFPRVEIIIITGCGTLESATEGMRIGIVDYLQKPFDLAQVNAAVSRALSRRSGQRRLLGFLEELGELVGRDAPVRTLLDRVEATPLLQVRVTELFESAEDCEPGCDVRSAPPRTFEFLEVLAETIESQDPFMRGHARRVAWCAGLLADRLCLSAQEREHVRMAAFLHDLGKIGVPSDLLMRPGVLTPEEHRVVQRHPGIGARLVQPLGIGTDVVAAIRHHHEWWNGRGYPDGLRGSEIPLVARIVTVVDAYDAMTFGRPYRRALTPERVRRELHDCAGTQFDPDLAPRFLQLLATGAWDTKSASLGDARPGAKRVAAQGRPAPGIIR